MDKINGLSYSFRIVVGIIIFVLLMGNGASTGIGNPVVTIIATVDIKPDTCNKDMSDMKEILAFIEIPNYDVNEIDVSTVKLSTEKGIVMAELSPKKVDDYDHDKIPDIKVTFNMHHVHQIVDMEDKVKLKISGMVSGMKFEGTDEILVMGKEEHHPPPPVPEQSTIVLVSLGLLGMLFFLRRSG